jgi:glycosyltransferase involved in cell wall biosynthesis
MKVGVALPVYNQVPQYIYECIRGIETQTYRDFELVIVMDGPNEETVKAVYAASKMLSIPYKIINRRENKGVAYSLNEGFALLKDCPYLTWVSSDNRQDPQFLNRLVHQLNTAPAHTVIAYSLYHPINEIGERHVNESDWHANMSWLMNRPKEEILQYNFIGASFLYKREAFERAGGYLPKYGMVSDYEFWMRLLRQGEITFLNEYLMEYRFNGKYSVTSLTPSDELLMEAIKASMDNRKMIGDIPKVTVIITAYNQEFYIQNAIQNVLNQDYPNFHLVIIDDGSTDLTWNKILGFRDPRIIPILILHRGKAAALNIGLNYALGEYVIELDGDDWIDPYTLGIMINEMDQQPSSVGLMYANRKIWYQTETRLLDGEVVKGQKYKDKKEILLVGKTQCPCLYRKSALLALGGWNNKLDGKEVVAVDFLMLLLMAEKYNLHWIDIPLYHQRQHPHRINLSLLHLEQLSEDIKFITKTFSSRWNRSQ